MDIHDDGNRGIFWGKRTGKSRSPYENSDFESVVSRGNTTESKPSLIQRVDTRSPL